MKKTISLLLTFVVIFSLLCSCKTPEEKKVAAFAKAIEKNDVIAMNEYVEKYFEWSDLLSEDAEFLSSSTLACYATPLETFDERLDYWKSLKGVIVELTVLPGFSQTYIHSSEKHNYIGEPVFVQKAQIKKIYKDYSESPTLEENLVIPISTHFAGINQYGQCVIQYLGLNGVCCILNEGHNYIAMLSSNYGVYYVGDFFPVDYNKEYEFLKPYIETPILGKGIRPLDSNGRIPFMQIARDLFEFCGVSDKYFVPSEPDWYKEKE